MEPQQTQESVQVQEAVQTQEPVTSNNPKKSHKPWLWGFLGLLLIGGGLYFYKHTMTNQNATMPIINLKDDIVGFWEAEGSDVTFSINADGTMNYPDDPQCTYTLTGNTFVQTCPTDTVTYTVSMPDKDTLSFQSDDDIQVFKRKSVDEQKPVSSETEQSREDSASNESEIIASRNDGINNEEKIIVQNTILEFKSIVDSKDIEKLKLYFEESGSKNLLQKTYEMEKDGKEGIEAGFNALSIPFTGISKKSFNNESLEWYKDTYKANKPDETLLGVEIEGVDIFGDKVIWQHTIKLVNGKWYWIASSTVD